MNKMTKITVIKQDQVSAFASPDEAQLQHWVDMTLTIANVAISANINEVTIRIVDRQESAQLNEQFRHKAYATNVLSFHYPHIPGVIKQSLGDIAICAEVVEREADQQQKALTKHWALMTIHGVLHLLGFDHETNEQAQVMEHLENKIMTQLKN